MAQKEIAWKATLDSDDFSKSLSGLKKEFKETQKELEGLSVGSEKYIQTLKKLGALKDEIGDLNTTIKSFSPEGKIQAVSTVIGGLASGFQAAQGAAALFGAEGEELQKTLLKVQAASAFADGIKGVVGLGDAFRDVSKIISASPLLILTVTITAIGTALFALKDKVGFIGDAFRAIGDTIGTLIDKGKQFLDWIGVTSFQLNKLNTSIIDNAKKAKDAIIDRYDSQIAAAKRDHKETVFLEIEKQKAILTTNKLAISSLEERRKVNGSLSDDEQKQLTDLIKSNSIAYKTISDSFSTYKDQQIAKNKSANDQMRKDTEDHFKRQQEYLNTVAKSQSEAEEKERLAAIAKVRQAELDSLNDIKNANDEYVGFSKEAIEQFFTVKQTFRDLDLEQERNSLQSIQNLSDIGFSIKLANTKKGSKEEEKILREQFKLNKAFQIANATINGIQAIQSILAQYPKFDGGFAMAAALIATGTASIANIAKIAATQFNSGSSGSGNVDTADLNLAGGGVALSPPSTGSTQLNPDGTIVAPRRNVTPIVRAIVTETDITSTQRRISSIEEKASF